MQDPNLNILSYGEFFLLCFTGPLFFFILFITSEHFPTFVSPNYVVLFVFILQGLLCGAFILRRDPNIDAELKTEMAGSVGPARAFASFAGLKFFVVMATTVGSMLIIVLPLYIFGKSINLF